jgi:hypothetical protein
VAQVDSHLHYLDLAFSTIDRNPSVTYVTDNDTRTAAKKGIVTLWKKQGGIELPRSKLTGYQNTAVRIYPKGVNPECLTRGSTVLTTTVSHVEWVGGPVPVSPGFPIKAFGNDGL